ncbi:hypothetical protein D3C79_871610 [compost metagenome]
MPRRCLDLGSAFGGVELGQSVIEHHFPVAQLGCRGLHQDEGLAHVAADRHVTWLGSKGQHGRLVVDRERVSDSDSRQLLNRDFAVVTNGGGVIQNAQSLLQAYDIILEVVVDVRKWELKALCLVIDHGDTLIR